MTGPALTWALRELVWSMRSEIEVVTSLSRRIDEHVTALNAARIELAECLVRLDALVDAADDPGLRDRLQQRAQAPLPMLDEVFPARLYGE